MVYLDPFEYKLDENPKHPSPVIFLSQQRAKRICKLLDLAQNTLADCSCVVASNWDYQLCGCCIMVIIEVSTVLITIWQLMHLCVQPGI